MSRSMAPVPLPHGYRTSTAMGARPLEDSGIHRPQSITHLRRRHPPGPPDHHRRRLARTLTGALHPGVLRPSRHILCRQASFWGSGLRDSSSHSGSVSGSYLPSAFVGQPVGIKQVGGVWIGGSGTTSHMPRNVDSMYVRY